MLTTHQLWLNWFQMYEPIYHIGRAMRKWVCGHMRTAKAQISLRIRAGSSGPSLSANKIIRYYRMYEWRVKARMILCACAELSYLAHYAQVRRHIFAWRGLYVNKMDHYVEKRTVGHVRPTKTQISLCIRRTHMSEISMCRRDQIKTRKAILQNLISCSYQI